MSPLPPRLPILRLHPNLPVLLETLPYHTQQILQEFLETGATYPLMEKAGNCMHADFQGCLILQILAGGDPRALQAVTEAALDELEYLLTTVNEEREGGGYPDR